MVRRSSMNETTAQVSFPTRSLGLAQRNDQISVIVQEHRALAIDLLIGLGLPTLNVILSASTPLIYFGSSGTSS